ncbi:MAG: hypothetical protein LBF74_05620 [Treponema sp.]|nr:hypothetical protein [Treponema sp.]
MLELLRKDYIKSGDAKMYFEKYRPEIDVICNSYYRKEISESQRLKTFQVIANAYFKGKRPIFNPAFPSVINSWKNIELKNEKQKKKPQSSSDLAAEVESAGRRGAGQYGFQTLDRTAFIG